MSKTVINRSTCDRCAKSVDSPPNWWGEMKFTDGYGSKYAYDLCQPCVQQLNTFMINSQTAEK